MLVREGLFRRSGSGVSLRSRLSLPHAGIWVRSFDLCCREFGTGECEGRLATGQAKHTIEETARHQLIGKV